MSEVGVCPECGSEVIGVEIWGVYDGVLYWTCPNDHRWHRWLEGTWQRERAEEFIDHQEEE